MRDGFPQKANGREVSGFTLVELLVATAVFSLLLAGLTEVLSSAQQMARAGTGLAGADAEVRTVAAVLERDLQRRFLGDGLPLTAEIDPSDDGSPEDDSFGILTMGPGYEGDRDLSWVEYRIRDGALLRGSRGFRFGEAADREQADDLLHIGMAAPALTDDDYQVVSDRVIRFEIGLIGWNAPEGDVNWAGLVSSGGGASVRFYMAVLSEDGAALLEGSDVETLKEMFRDAESGQSPLPAWREALVGAIGSGGNGLPVAALQSVRFYETLVSLY